MTDPNNLRRKVAIVGAGITPLGKHPGRDRYQLAMEAFKQAMDDAGIEKNRIDAVFGAAVNGPGIEAEAFSALIGINPKVTGSLVYASCGLMVQHAAAMIAAGLCSVALCVFARNPPGAMEALSGPRVHDPASGLINAAAVAAMGWTQHMAKYGTTEEDLGRVAVAARKYAMLNPGAAFRDPLTLDQYLEEEYIIWPFRELDIAKVSAAGVALILTTREIAADLRKPPVYLEAFGRQQAVRVLENEDHLLCRPMGEVAKQVYGASGLKPADIDAFYVYDASTAVVLQSLENYGFCGEGESGDFIKDGRIEPGGELPFNTYGGHLSGGYLMGWPHHVEIVRQLRGECGPRQVAGAKVAQFAMTGRFREDFLSTIFVAE